MSRIGFSEASKVARLAEYRAALAESIWASASAAALATLGMTVGSYQTWTLPPSMAPINCCTLITTRSRFGDALSSLSMKLS